MAHYAYINSDNIVIAVIVGKDENDLIDGLDPESYYAQGTDYTVKRTSYNGKIRKHFAGVGYQYIPEIDIFIPPKPYDSWILDENYDWVAPVKRPEGSWYYWDEQNLEWKWHDDETLA